MNMYFDVEISDIEEDASIEVIKEAIEIALAKEIPFLGATVTYSEWQE